MSKLETALTTGKAPSREVSAYERFRGQLGALRKDIAGLTGEKNVDKFVRVCLNAVQANPSVLGADRRSLLLSCLRAAQDGLLPDGREAVLNVFNTKEKKDGRDVWTEKVQYMPMSYGLVQKIYEAGATFVDAVAVYERDVFEYARGDEPKIKHVPYDGNEDPGAVKAAYAIVKLKTGETKREVMFKRDIENVRSKSRAKDGMMWGQFYDQAAIKSVIHRIVKQLPRSESLDLALASDNLAQGLEGVTVEASGANLEELVAHAGTVEPPPPAPTPPAIRREPPPADDDGGDVPVGRGPRGPMPPTPAAATPEARDRIVAALERAGNRQTLDDARDEANGHGFTPPDLALIDAAYQAGKRRFATGSPGEPPGAGQLPLE